MRSFLTLLLFLALATVSASAQMVQDASYRIVGHIKSDGTVQDASYRITGHVKSDGTVQDASTGSWAISNRTASSRIRPIGSSAT